MKGIPRSGEAGGSIGIGRELPALSGFFTWGFLVLALAVMGYSGFDAGMVFRWVVLPFLALCLAYQALDPLRVRPIEKNEFITDLLSLGVVYLITTYQNTLIQGYLAGLARGWGGLSAFTPAWLKLSGLPVGLECLIVFLIYDFGFYLTHRLAHANPFLWKLHSVHHCPDKVTYLNSNRIHPLDLLIRRTAPLLPLLSLGMSEHAFVCLGVLLNILGPITHVNIDLRHGAMNYLIGTNEVHVWHHSAKPEEAGNYGITMIWDHLFRTFYWPKDRRVPERLGLADPAGFPLHDYLKQTLLVRLRDK